MDLELANSIASKMTIPIVSYPMGTHRDWPRWSKGYRSGAIYGSMTTNKIPDSPLTIVNASLSGNRSAQEHDYYIVWFSASLNNLYSYISPFSRQLFNRFADNYMIPFARFGVKEDLLYTIFSVGSILFRTEYRTQHGNDDDVEVHYSPVSELVQEFRIFNLHDADLISSIEQQCAIFQKLADYYDRYHELSCDEFKKLRKYI